MIYYPYSDAFYNAIFHILSYNMLLYNILPKLDAVNNVVLLCIALLFMLCLKQGH
jgi:hypothetical protein